MKYCNFPAFLMASPSFVGAVGQTKSKQIHGCVSAGTSPAKPKPWAIFSAEQRFAWHIPGVGPEGAQGCSLILQLGPSQALPGHPWCGVKPCLKNSSADQSNGAGKKAGQLRILIIECKIPPQGQYPNTQMILESTKAPHTWQRDSGPQFAEIQALEYKQEAFP